MWDFKPKSLAYHGVPWCSILFVHGLFYHPGSTLEQSKQQSNTDRCMWMFSDAKNFNRNGLCFLTRARPGVWATFARPGGGGGWPPPQGTRKLRKIATSGKRRWIGRGKFYKKYLDHFLIRSNLRSQGVKKVKFSQNQVIFAENRNYLNNYTS